MARSKKVDKKYRDLLKKELVFFGEIDMVVCLKCPGRSFIFTATIQSYRLLLGICELLTEGKIMAAEQGTMRLTDFADDQRMSHLYEKFILEYYVQEYAQKYRGFTAKGCHDSMTVGRWQ